VGFSDATYRWARDTLVLANLGPDVCFSTYSRGNEEWVELRAYLLGRVRPKLYRIRSDGYWCEAESSQDPVPQDAKPKVPFFEAFVDVISLIQKEQSRRP
jgi:hypothetical protein